MKPTRSQIRWLTPHVPVGLKAVDLVPRAYVIAKPAVACVVAVTPQADYCAPLTQMHQGKDPYYSAVVLRDPYTTRGRHRYTVSDLEVGQWITLVFMERAGGSCEWLYVPLMPWRGKQEPEGAPKA